MKILFRLLFISTISLLFVFGVFQLAQAQFFVSMEQGLGMSSDSSIFGFYADPYPPPPSSDPSSPYPAPASEENSPANNVDGAGKVKDALLKDAKMYASMNQVSVDEAVRRLTLQDSIGDLNAILIDKEKDTFAGLWIQHEGGFKVLVRFTRDGNRTIKSYIQDTPLDDIIEVRSADVSLEELRNEQTEVLRMMDQSGIPYMTGIDVRDSKVVLYVYDKHELLDYLENMKMELPAHTRINEADLLGEEVINIHGGLELSAC